MVFAAHESIQYFLAAFGDDDRVELHGQFTALQIFGKLLNGAATNVKALAPEIRLTALLGLDPLDKVLQPAKGTVAMAKQLKGKSGEIPFLTNTRASQWYQCGL